MKRAPRSILVVDDEESIRFILSESLGGAGFQVDTAENGRVALDRMRERPYDIVLTDVRMPFVSGLDLLGHIKRDYPRTEVVVMTSNTSLEASIEANEKGACFFVMKPFYDLESVTQLVTRIAAQLDAQSARNEMSELLDRYDAAIVRALGLDSAGSADGFHDAFALAASRLMGGPAAVYRAEGGALVPFRVHGIAVGDAPRVAAAAIGSDLAAWTRSAAARAALAAGSRACVAVAPLAGGAVVAWDPGDASAGPVLERLAARLDPAAGRAGYRSP